MPLMDHPSETFLAQLEEDMMKLILKHGMMVKKKTKSNQLLWFLNYCTIKCNVHKILQFEKLYASQGIDPDL